jgi:hypothetical protein
VQAFWGFEVLETGKSKETSDQNGVNVRNNVLDLYRRIVGLVEDEGGWRSRSCRESRDILREECRS